MTKRLLTLLLAAALLLLSGCDVGAELPRLSLSAAMESLASRFAGREAAEASDGVLIYRRAADEAAGGDLIRPESYPAETDEPAPAEILAAFAAPAGDERLVCALPDGVTVEDWRVEDGLMTLDLSESYLALSEMDRAVTAFCAALTLCQLDAVDSVTVTAGGETVFPGLVPEDAFLDAGEPDPYVRRLRLYFPDSAGRYLVSEYHSLTLDEDASPERYVVEELLRGPNSAELRRAVPEGTALLSCVTENGVCTVDLSREFYTNRPRTALGERLVLYALVDSLTALSSVDSVRILVEGRAPAVYVYRSLADPIARYDRVLGPASAPKGETDADLFLPLPGLRALAPLPFRISEADYDSPAQALLAELISVREPGYPALFSGGTANLRAAAEGSLCTVDLPESFFVSLPDNARTIAVQAIAATICSLPEIDAVRFTIGGGDAVFGGADWSGPWQNFDTVITE